MRISRTLPLLALASVLAMASVSVAQDTKSDAPADAAVQFGPRAGKAAQGGQQGNAPKAETVATHGAWQVQCSDVMGKDNKVAGKSCRMLQLSKSEKDQKLGISIAVSQIKQGDKTMNIMQVLAPIGVYLPTGIAVEIDGQALPTRLPFTRCVPAFCEGFAEASPETLAKFKKGTAAIFYIYDRPGNGFPMKVSLEGFGNALAELAKH